MSLWSVILNVARHILQRHVLFHRRMFRVIINYQLISTDKTFGNGMSLSSPTIPIPIFDHGHTTGVKGVDLVAFDANLKK